MGHKVPLDKLMVNDANTYLTSSIYKTQIWFCLGWFESVSQLLEENSFAPEVKQTQDFHGFELKCHDCPHNGAQLYMNVDQRGIYLWLVDR